MTSTEDPGHTKNGTQSLFKGNSILKNVGWSTIHLLMSKGVRFFAIAFCVKMIGVESWGGVATTLVTISFMYFLVDQGLGTAPTLFRVGDQSFDNFFLKRISLYRFTMAIVLILVVQLINKFLIPINSLICIYSFALLPRSLNLDWWFQRQEKYHLYTSLANFRVILFLIAAYFLVKKGGSANVILYIELAVEILGCIVGYFLYRIQRPLNLNPTKKVQLNFGLLDLVKIGFPFFIIGILNTIHQSIDIVFIKHMCGYKEVGDYDIGYRISFFLFFIGAGIIQVIRPKMARLSNDGQINSISQILSSCSKILAGLSCLYMIISFYFAHFLISLVFHEAGPLTHFVFQWSTLWVATAFMTMLCADTMLSLGDRRSYIFGAIYCAIANILGNYIFITFFGSQGAIFATLFAEVVFLVYTFSKLPYSIRAPLSVQLRPQAIAILLLATLFLFSMYFKVRLPFILSSIVIFFGLLMFQGTLKKSTIASLLKN